VTWVFTQIQGKKIIASIGQFGPYVNHNSKFKAIPKSDDIFKITHEEAVELLKPLRRIGIDPATNSTIDIYKGRFGFYLQRDAIKVNIAKNLNYENIELEKAIQLITKKELEEKERKRPLRKRPLRKRPLRNNC
jgi:DNA topoisomerase-1